MNLLIGKTVKPFYGRAAREQVWLFNKDQDEAIELDFSPISENGLVLLPRDIEHGWNSATFPNDVEPLGLLRVPGELPLEGTVTKNIDDCGAGDVLSSASKKGHRSYFVYLRKTTRPSIQYPHLCLDFTGEFSSYNNGSVQYHGRMTGIDYMTKEEAYAKSKKGKKQGQSDFISSD